MSAPGESNHELPKTGIPKRKKASLTSPLSCKIDYLIPTIWPLKSIASTFFTDDPGLMDRAGHPLLAEFNPG
jgi:hypothetical protein